jgi:DNA gyrase subunit A
MDIARNDTELFVVTENGYGKRTPVSDYPVKGRGTKGVLTIRITEKKGGLAGALIVNPHQDLLFISQNGMVQRTSVSGISQMGRSTQGVKVMNIKDDDRVSAVALAAESEDDVDIPAISNDPNADQIEIDPSVNGAVEDDVVADDVELDEGDE